MLQKIMGIFQKKQVVEERSENKELRFVKSGEFFVEVHVKERIVSWIAKDIDELKFIFSECSMSNAKLVIDDNNLIRDEISNRVIRFEKPKKQLGECKDYLLVICEKNAEQAYSVKRDKDNKKIIVEKYYFTYSQNDVEFFCNKEMISVEFKQVKDGNPLFSQEIIWEYKSYPEWNIYDMKRAKAFCKLRFYDKVKYYHEIFEKLCEVKLIKITGYESNFSVFSASFNDGKVFAGYSETPILHWTIGLDLDGNLKRYKLENQEFTISQETSKGHFFEKTEKYFTSDKKEVEALREKAQTLLDECVEKLKNLDY